MTNAEPHGFRRWRRTRPFWGGVFAVLGGIELIAIPLAPMPVTIHQGMAGVASWLIGALLIAAGVLLWFQPAQRSFFGILIVLLSLASFLTSNFGGFLLGLLLGLAGGAMGFAWSPLPSRRDDEETDRTTVHGYILDPKPGFPADTVPQPQAPAPAPAPAPANVQPQPNGGRGAHAAPRNRRLMAFAAPALLPAVLGVQFLNPAPSPQATPEPAASPSASPSPTPSTTQTPASGVPAPGTSATPGAPTSPEASASPEPSAGKPEECPEIPADTSGLSQSEAGKLLRDLKGAADPQACLKAGKAKPAASGFQTYTDPSTLRASSLTMSGLSYDGVAELGTRSGTVRALKFSMSKAVLKNVDQTAARTTIRTPSLTLNGGVVMYTTKMSSKLLGIPLTFTPDQPPPLTLPFMVMTDVVSEQATVRAGGAEIDALAIRA
ncbi:DUF6114 domain-containing protein [Actinomadura fulvescens]|uniref:Uncharacterized protein n=1 Tax=Actinomadura fulvescens TaxID=46160 RepID=A0ABP6C2X2_9ACTN